MGVIDPLDGETSHVAGWSVLRYNTIRSGSETARSLIAASAVTKRTCIVARSHSGGQAPAETAWSGEPGGLWISLIVPAPPPEPPMHLWAGVAIADVIGGALDDAGRVGVCWPNEVVVDDRCVAGAVSETVYGPEGGRYAVLSIGINVNQDDQSDEFARVAITLRQATGREHDLDELLASLLSGLNALPCTSDAVLERWVKGWRHRGARVLVGADREPMVIRGLTTGGAVVCADETRDGIYRVIYSLRETPVVCAEDDQPGAV